MESVLIFINIFLVNQFVKRLMEAPERCEPFIKITQYGHDK